MHALPAAENPKPTGPRSCGATRSVLAPSFANRCQDKYTCLRLPCQTNAKEHCLVGRVGVQRKKNNPRTLSNGKMHNSASDGRSQKSVNSNRTMVHLHKHIWLTSSVPTEKRRVSVGNSPSQTHDKPPWKRNRWPPPRKVLPPPFRSPPTPIPAHHKLLSPRCEPDWLGMMMTNDNDD